MYILEDLPLSFGPRVSGLQTGCSGKALAVGEVVAGWGPAQDSPAGAGDAGLRVENGCSCLAFH